MTIKIRKGGWSEELIIETDQGEAKIFVSGNELKIQGEEILMAIGLSTSDALALFFDQAASQQTRARFQTYLSRKGG
jgi:hypothetical protein